ncbi:hypothetical protein JKP88DRAFT_263452 [Tribonema minus]|uniref:Uncharacterized protein n=1 Tax=Tribonema minus TaxID=303371 RepID=A0A836CFJ3_9STRA|nr:hypothetical protein JKP88DRAFT_263452 [Tribonema minus]
MAASEEDANFELQDDTDSPDDGDFETTFLDVVGNISCMACLPGRNPLLAVGTANEAVGWPQLSNGDCNYSAADMPTVPQRSNLLAVYRPKHGAIDISGVENSEGGCVLEIDIERMRVKRRMVSRGALPLTAVAFQGRSEGHVFATTGSAPGSQLCLWDLRVAQGAAPTEVCAHASPGAAYTCVMNCPLTPESFCAGATSGEVVIWDTRNPREPQIVVNHDSEVRAVVAHTRQQRGFSADAEGLVLDWETAGAAAAAAAGAPPPRTRRLRCGDGAGHVAACWHEEGRAVYAVTRHGALTACEGL